MLMPVARILARGRNDRVIFLPSDHYVANPAPIERALEVSSRAELEDRITLIGVNPTSPETEYGWIARGAAIGCTGASTVDAFREKPTQEVARQLHEHGALWNTFISSANVNRLWRLAHEHLPRHAELLERYATAVGSLDEVDVLESAYREMTPANFSRDLLARTESLAVIPVAGTGWTDWGSPSRVFASLSGTPSHERLLERVGGEFALAV
jgi:mannose-1-phosphate guanylyltransferase